MSDRERILSLKPRLTGRIAEAPAIASFNSQSRSYFGMVEFGEDATGGGEVYTENADGGCDRVVQQGEGEVMGADAAVTQPLRFCSGRS